MSSVAQSVPLPLHSDAKAIAVSLEAHHGEQLHTAWKSVFEKIQNVVLGEESASPEQRDQLPPDFRDFDRPSNQAVSVTTGEVDEISSVAKSQGRAQQLSMDSSISVKSAADQSCTPPLISRPVIANNAVISRSETCATRRVDAARSTPNLTAFVPQPTEAVVVHVIGSSVAIAVRDREISDDEALQCAFETARELTGRSASLVRLVVNGRALYSPQPSATDVDHPPLFVC